MDRIHSCKRGTQSQGTGPHTCSPDLTSALPVRRGKGRVYSLLTWPTISKKQAKIHLFQDTGFYG